MKIKQDSCVISFHILDTNKIKTVYCFIYINLTKTQLSILQVKSQAMASTSLMKSYSKAMQGFTEPKKRLVVRDVHRPPNLILWLNQNELQE